MLEVAISGTRVRLSPSDAIGKGGEADVYDIGGGKVLKLFKPPDHPDYAGEPVQQVAARSRIEAHQNKLRVFPKGLPARVVSPLDLALTPGGRKIVGFTMPYLKGTEVLLRYSDRQFREGRISNQHVVEIFRDLHATVGGIHTAGVVIGDFNDLNVLVKGSQAHVIDADSFQFGNYLCQMFTAKFVDPLLCNPKEHSPNLVKPHNPNSDWYAYAVMLMQCLLYVDPYGGVYRPKDSKKRVLHSERPLRRITVFDREVIYPKPARPYHVLSDDLLDFFQRTFIRDERGMFPYLLFEQMRWTTCTVCKTEHSRSTCPKCATPMPAAVVATITVRGRVTATRIVRTPGLIVAAEYQNGELGWCIAERGKVRRENNELVSADSLDAHATYRLCGKATLVASAGRVMVYREGKPVSSFTDETRGVATAFAANGEAYYYTRSGQLLRSRDIADQYVGNVLSTQTLLHMGPAFGFGLYRAGALSVAFVFRDNQQGINDNVSLPPVRGQLVETSATFTKEWCWFFTKTNETGVLTNRCAVIGVDGKVVAIASAIAGDGSWLSSIRGKTAVGNVLLAPTDDGVVQLKIEAGQIVEAKRFPDTEPFVSEESKLFAGSQGLYAVSTNEIVLLKIA